MDSYRHDSHYRRDEHKPSRGQHWQTDAGPFVRSHFGKIIFG